MPPIRIPIERRFSDIDLLGHVNNVAYHDYLQEARVRLLTRLGRETVGIPAQVVARHEIDYLRPLPASTEPVIVETWIESVGRSSYVVAYRMLDTDGTVAARARTVMVFVDAASGASVPVPPQFRTWLESARGGPEEG